MIGENVVIGKNAVIHPHVVIYAGAQIGDDLVDTDLVDQTQSGVRDAQAHPAVFRFHKETAVLQVRQEPTLGFVVGVGNVVAHHRAFARDFTFACHEDTPFQQPPDDR